MSEKGFNVGTSFGIFSDIDEAYARVLENVLQKGHRTSTLDSRTNKLEQSRECAACQFALYDPLDRIIHNPVRRFNIASTVGRFTLMIAATDLIERFAVYDPRVRNFSDNGVTLDGSDYGKRLFSSGDDAIDQIQAIIQELKVQGTRRAAATIYSAEDTIRESKDIPCVLSIQYLIRDSKLITITNMRSNNLYSLVPHNVFEFTMLAEIIARTLGVEMGPYVHISNSLHVFEREVEKAQQVISGVSAIKYQYRMDRMPSSPDPLGQARLLAKLEEDLFSMFKNNEPFDYPTLLAKGKVLNSYWLQFYEVLLSTYFVNLGNLGMAEKIAVGLPSYFRRAILPEVAALSPPSSALEASETSPKSKQLSLDGKPVNSTFARMRKQLSASPDEKRKSLLEFEDFCYENKVLRQEAKALYQSCIVDIPVAIAARKQQTIRERLEAALLSIRHLD